MSDMKLVVGGASGRMGRALIRAIHETPGVVLCGAVEHENHEDLGEDSGEIAGIGYNSIPIIDDPYLVFLDSDGVLDFTVPESSVQFSILAAQLGIVHVIGTTGCTVTDEEKFDAASHQTRIVKSDNMSLGVNLLAALIHQAARTLSAIDFDIDVLEMHHKYKVDAPSGTALFLGAAAAEGRNIDLDTNSVRTRNGIIGQRKVGSIGFATLRGGSVIGDHSVLFAGEGEIIELSHRAFDRQIFAKGAVKAALWAHDKIPGRYDMYDVLGLSKKM
ncbi:4-hydroxy-tetrahydrodipicolinate reductase [Candidatus Endowatersipora endosymbiont of Watersipora subatra]|uniref:4-hydroxy-tetrahydrodipicolinate reductase n=1 Tax=Candidatus Endowatersipora endosymbiont of Watersipora subatra TaxID=3077946 RepID=UPI00312C75AA